jgi:tripartite-type tricarboxylate transporter receptor subunit TctC
MSNGTTVARPAMQGPAATRRRVLAGLATFPSVAVPARAQRGFPDRPIRIVVPYGPGTGNDSFARQFTARFPQILGVPAVIDNRPGANAILGTEIAARSAPDGYTLLFGAEQAVCYNPALYRRPLPYDMLRDFTPIAGLVTASYVLVVTPNLPARSVPELVAMAKANPGSISFGSTGAGTASRIIGEVFARDAGIELTSVAYQSGTAPLFADLLAGRLSMMFYPFQFVRELLATGRARALATTGAERAPFLPDLPTLGELGYRRSTASSSFGVYAPAGTPADRIERIAEAFREALHEPALHAQLSSDGTAVDFVPPAEFGAVFAARLDRCREMVTIAGASLD